jgi:hypothetical protein
MKERMQRRRNVFLILLASLALFAFACTGDDGRAGDQGPPGAAGNAGADGAPGADGAVGRAGDTGPQGIQGGVGPTGDQGPSGLNGAAGSDGSDGADAIGAALVVHDSNGTQAGAVTLGSTMDILGGGFTAGEVILLLIGSSALNAGEVVANSDGAFAALNVPIPSAISAGVAVLTATGDNDSMGLTAISFK